MRITWPLSAPAHTWRGGSLFIWAAVSLKDIPVWFSHASVMLVDVEGGDGGGSALTSSFSHLNGQKNPCFSLTIHNTHSSVACPDMLLKTIQGHTNAHRHTQVSDLWLNGGDYCCFFIVASHINLLRLKTDTMVAKVEKRAAAGKYRIVSMQLWGCSLHPWLYSCICSYWERPELHGGNKISCLKATKSKNL